MSVIQITIEGTKFLLPVEEDGYVFPTYILEHREQIVELIKKGDALLSKLSDPFSQDAELAQEEFNFAKQQLRVFIETTKIIGTPFDLRNPDLVIIDQNLTVELEIDL